MNVVSYSETRANLKEVMDRVVEDHDPVIVTRKRGEAVVMISLADWNAMDATRYLLSTEANERELMESIRQLEAGEGQVRELIEP